MAKIGSVLPANLLQDGEIGVEIEVEGSRLPDELKLWKKDADGSLRGESAEYVLKRPIKKTQVKDALTELSEAFRKSRSSITTSYRAGIHVHVNVQDMTFTQCMNYVFLYFLVEEQLIRFCDRSRRGNHFCLRLSDAGYLAEVITKFCVTEDVEVLRTDAIRYASINLKCIPQYGSLEFRALESTTDWYKVGLWVDVLHHLKQQALTFSTPTAILEEFSKFGAKDFVEKVLGQYTNVLPRCDVKVVNDAMHDIQWAVYSRKWASVNNNIFSKKSLF